LRAVEPSGVLRWQLDVGEREHLIRRLLIGDSLPLGQPSATAIGDWIDACLASLASATTSVKALRVSRALVPRPGQPAAVAPSSSSASSATRGAGIEVMDFAVGGPEAPMPVRAAVRRLPPVGVNAGIGTYRSSFVCDLL
jgi:hypothetical protein